MMKLNKVATVLCVVAFLALPCLAAKAAPLNTVDIVHPYGDFGAKQLFEVWGGGYEGEAVYGGVYTLVKSDGTGEGELWPNGRLGGFCVELQEVAPMYTYTYEVMHTEDVYNSHLSDFIGAEKADYLSELWGRFYNSSWFDSGSYSSAQNSGAAAFSASIWEIIYEDLPSSSLDAWDVSVDGTTGDGGFAANLDFITEFTANSWLGMLDGTGPKADLRIFTRNGSQDYIIEVPEPATVALLGLGGIFSLIRRKRTAA